MPDRMSEYVPKSVSVTWWGSLEESDFYLWPLRASRANMQHRSIKHLHAFANFKQIHSMRKAQTTSPDCL